MKYYYVITDESDPGSEHDTWEEAAEAVRDLHNQGIDGYILGPDLNFCQIDGVDINLEDW